MALNQTEQQLFDYIQKNPEERHFWEQKVRTVAAAYADDFATAAKLDLALRAYLVERVSVVRQLAALPTGISMRNLADYLIRIWTNPRPKKKKSESDFPA